MLHRVGSPKFDTVRALAYRTQDIILIFFDITNRDSFFSVRNKVCAPTRLYGDYVGTHKGAGFDSAGCARRRSLITTSCGGGG